MNKFIIVEGLPYLLANGKVFSVRWDESGFTVGAEVEMASVPDRTYSELSVKAKCAGNLDSISAPNSEQEDQDTSEQEDQDGDTEATEEDHDEKPLDEMTLEELKEYAKAHDINLGGARTKATIIEAINASKEQAVS